MPPFLKLQSPLNAPPTPFEVAQRNITQCCYHHRNFESDIPRLACDRTLIPNLVHRRDNKCKAQSRCSKSSCSQWKPRWYVPVFKVVEREVAPAEIQVLDADRRQPCSCRCPSRQGADQQPQKNVQITCAISDNTQEIIKSVIELVLPYDGQRKGPLCIRFSSSQETSSIHTYTAVIKMDNRYLGRATSGGIRVWRLMQIEYVDGALVAVTLKLNSTTRNLPNLPTGESIALRSPPTLPPA